MRFYEVDVTIQAPAARVWEVLTDAAGYVEWDSGIVRLEGNLTLDGKLKPGGKLKVYSAISPKRAFPVSVTQLEGGRRMTWEGGMPIPGLFKGVRTFVLTEDGSATNFLMREQFTGLLLPLMWRVMPDLQPTFDQFANGLKAQAESGG